MGEAVVDVTVKTRFATAQSLMAVVSTGIERGALRLPATIACGRTFEIALLTATGEVAVRGTAESVRQDGGTTLVRFLSATDDGGDRDAWVDLDDAVVNVPMALAVPRVGATEGTVRPRARARERNDWAGALGTPLPPESARPPLPPVKAMVPPLPPARATRPVAPAMHIPDIPPLAETRPSGAMDLPELAPLATGSTSRVPTMQGLPSMPTGAPTTRGLPATPPGMAPPELPSMAPGMPVAAAPGNTMPPPIAGNTLPPPFMAVFAAPGAGYYMAPAPSWPTDAPTDARMRPTTLPPGWGPEQGRMWIPVMDPSMMAATAAAPPVAPAPVVASSSGRAARGVLIASVVIATAGAAVAVSAVMWARSVSAERGSSAAAATAPPVTAPAPALVAAPAPAVAPVPAAAAAAVPELVPAPAPPPPSAAVAVAAVAQAPRPADCRIAITTNADSVGVFVEGVRRAQTPATIAVPCAPTTVVLRHARYEEQIRHLEPTRDPIDLHVIMARPSAQLRVVTRPSGMTVTVDGRTVGRSPLTTTVDGFERARVTLSGAGMLTEERRVYAKSGTTMLMVTLKKK